jgi:integrase
LGYAKKRVGRGGKTHYTACYLDLRGRLRSAGTFPSKKLANKAWQDAESKLSEGRVGDPRRGRLPLKRYVEEQWLPHHVMEATTRESYTYLINKYIVPWFGPMRMVEILPAQVREWITHLRDRGVSPATTTKLRFILSAIFTTALNDQVVFAHPCKGVKVSTVPVKPRMIITPEQFDALYDALPNPDLKLLIEAEIETGLRWGELTELRPTDLDVPSRTLTISRAVVQVNPKFHPEGRRFLVKDYPKDKEYRRVKISAQLTEKLQKHIENEQIDPDSLLFAMRQPEAESPPPPLPDPGTLGLTEPNEQGRRYRHGTCTAYNLGKCRCSHCRRAYATYRAERRKAGKDRPGVGRRKSVDTDGHISRDWFRNQVWAPAQAIAGLKVKVRVHDLRHAHASWLLAGGADLQVVKERLGHGSIKTTERYLHTLPDNDETALDAFTSIRYRAR